MPLSTQLQSVAHAFGEQGWQHEVIEEREVLSTQFEAHHTRIHLHAQVFKHLNALSIVGESPFETPTSHLPALLELLMRGNKQLTLGAFEFDFDRHQLVFRSTNLFDKDKFDPDIIASLVHCSIAELDRLVPLASILLKTDANLLPDLSLEMLLLREDLLPPVANEEGDFEEEEL